MKKIITELKNSFTDDQFLEFTEKVNKEAEVIEKQKRLNEITIQGNQINNGVINQTTPR